MTLLLLLALLLVGCDRPTPMTSDQATLEISGVCELTRDPASCYTGAVRMAELAEALLR